MSNLTLNAPSRTAHLFASEDGAMYSPASDWHKRPALRPNYKRHHREIKSLADVKASLRAGPYAWPGGYAVFYVTHDGASLCYDCVKDEFAQVVWDFLHNSSTGWRIEGADLSYGDAEMEGERPVCDNCGKEI